MNDPTTDSALISWVEVAPDSDFPIQNLPYGVFRAGAGAGPRIGVAIGDWVIDLAAIHEAGLFSATAIAGENLFASEFLNDFMARGGEVWGEVRRRISELLRADNPELRDAQRLRERALVRRERVAMQMPVAVGDFIDFYSSREHATNAGSLFRDPKNALPPNWLHLPIAYHGRAGSLRVSPREVRRPRGQVKPSPEAAPIFAPSSRLDFELEVGFFVGVGNGDGYPIPTEVAHKHIFGAVLLNDWSARDIQQWEYQPLGPFLGKSFATSISPWVVPLAALVPFRVAGPAQDPPVLPYLRYTGEWNFDINLEVSLKSAAMESAVQITATNFRRLYWNVLQHLAHATVNGARMRPGDLFASGTVSGTTPGSLGSMLEISRNGKEPITLPGGERRGFLEDGDTVTMRGWCQGSGYRIGFGECTGRIEPCTR
ncbi:MAG TPA: fumarylacetoacetase [Candidatus Binataceae bacterium]|nr:fumarylacetoacetase [Candidatus Binataceae bacterium]